MPAAQDLALRPSTPTGRDGVVLATAIAETSPHGARRAHRHRWRLSPRAALQSCERPDPTGDRTCGRAAADQRAGRAGREARGPGRPAAWTSALRRGLRPGMTVPEMPEAELSRPGAGLRRLGHAARQA